MKPQYLCMMHAVSGRVPGWRHDASFGFMAREYDKTSGVE
ncbi:MAG: hypothetical protein A4E42_01192 [Methanoregulaceae archaeon PtaU1.Bin222]|nr:MAG: hypothetical protein A4E42_01192 [Methanoregulaceae archaeon PtaU1.Bin222]